MGMLARGSSIVVEPSFGGFAATPLYSLTVIQRPHVPLSPMNAKLISVIALAVIPISPIDENWTGGETRPQRQRPLQGAAVARLTRGISRSLLNSPNRRLSSGEPRGTPSWVRSIG